MAGYNPQTFCSGNLVRKIIQTPLGQLGLVASESGMRAIVWPQFFDRDDFKKIPVDTNIWIVHCIDELENYFLGRLRNFSVALDIVGTEFQKASWWALRSIPYGELRSYQAQALQLGGPQKCRAVGNANGKNPLPIVVPCHRVVGKSGKLTGFAGGLDIKRFLIELEHSHCKKRVD